jgi:hypothetical protein
VTHLESLSAMAIREAEDIDRMLRSLASAQMLVAARRFQAEVTLFVERLKAAAS